MSIVALLEKLVEEISLAEERFFENPKNFDDLENTVKTSAESFSLTFSSLVSSNTTEAFSRNSVFHLRRRFGWISFSAASSLMDFSPLMSSITRSDLNLAVKLRM